MEQNQDYLDVFESQRNYKFKAKNTSASYRIGKLKAFKEAVLKNKERIAQALGQDFRKPTVETDLTEIMPVISMINLLERELGSWMKDQKVKTPLLFKGSKSWVRYEGKGNCLIIAPWNYPFQLCAYPILTAFAAGNTCMVKPSEYTLHTNQILIELFSQIFSRDEVCFFEGEVFLSTELLKLPFDHVFFTGSTQVGRIVAEAAAKNLASVSLELGGKSPCIVDKRINHDKAIKRISWGKMVNSGQTCVAPDYLMVYEDEVDKICSEIKKNIEEFYPGGDFANSPDYNQMISNRHGERLSRMIKGAVNDGAEIVFGGTYHESTRSLEPTIIKGVTKDMELMKEEIFGPVLPVLTFKTKEEMIDFINGLDNPLSLYIFTEDESFEKFFLENTHSGGASINDTLLSVGHPLLPFGGAGKSGIGNYHGKYGFEEFSNLRSVFKRKTDLGMSYFYPPYDEKKTGVVDKLLRKFSKIF